jgi:hypothetical protein
MKVAAAERWRRHGIVADWADWLCTQVGRLSGGQTKHIQIKCNEMGACNQQKAKTQIQVAAQSSSARAAVKEPFVAFSCSAG